MSGFVRSSDFANILYADLRAQSDLIASGQGSNF